MLENFVLRGWRWLVLARRQQLGGENGHRFRSRGERRTGRLCSWARGRGEASWGEGSPCRHSTSTSLNPPSSLTGHPGQSLRMTYVGTACLEMKKCMLFKPSVINCFLMFTCICYEGFISELKSQSLPNTCIVYGCSLEVRDTLVLRHHHRRPRTFIKDIITGTSQVGSFAKTTYP